ncbi:unnamed protein product [Alternaria sp. RS040]
MDGMDERKWYPLETVLSFWLSQIRQGSIQATSEKGGKLREEWSALGENRDPSNWVFVPYNEAMMKRNLEIWDKLVEAIESRMPMESIAAQPIYGLLEDNVRKTISLQQRFAYNFLFRARRPRSKKIAPGLRVIASSDFPDQPFRSHMSKDKDEIPPILLFRSELNFFEDPTWSPRNSDARRPHFYDYRDVRIYPSGLYLLPTEYEHQNLEDQISFILPFAIGGNEYARMSDGQKFMDCRQYGNDSFTQLYSRGRQSLEDFQSQSLACVLENWLGMVEGGIWKVDGNGVVGDMETWKEADTKEGWEKYVIPNEESFHHDWEVLKTA